MAAIKIVYFPVRARTEAIHLCLAYGKIPYQDVTPTAYFGCGWRDGAKEKTPWGGLPIMEVDGKVISQTGSCTRYCAAMANLIPSDQIMAAQCDAVFEASQDFGGINPIVNMFTGDVFQAKKDEFFQTFPSKLAQVAKQLGSGPFFLGDKPYYCDFGMYHMLSNVALVEPSALDEHENVKKFMGAVEGLDGVKEYLDKRPDAVGVGEKPMLQPKE